MGLEVSETQKTENVSLAEKLNKPKEALVAYEENLRGSPHRFNGVYGAAIASKLSGNLEKATRYFNQLIDLTKDSDSDRPEIEEAKAFVAQAI